MEHFKQNQQSYRSGRFNEARLRLEFLNPLFEALGWDVANRSGYAEAYKDVLVEPSLEMEGEIKAPDYAFRIGGTRKFFVEAKKPAVNIQYEIYPAFQLRRYAWSAKLPLGILTDFEEFAVYDCRSKPNPTDQAATGRVMFIKFTDYIEKWDEIAAIFSREAVLKGSFDQYAQGVTGKHGTQEVDDAFLKEIEGWRDLLARNLALRNNALSVPELNYAVQMTIDRIVFLRICEDRGIEPQEQLKDLLEQEDIYGGLCDLFRKADTRYNSGLFHFEKEKAQSSSPDGLSLGLKIDDKALKEIIKSLYFPSPYVFSVIPADILGQVYERFLGKVIRLTASHQAKVEEKPEVRKAGGVYYTPTYIVEYIVKNTVGKLLEGKTPREAAELKIVDPACGSGSFLLGAYQCLLDWHTKWYIDNNPLQWAKSASPRVYQAQGGALRQAQDSEWKLTTAEKKRILLDNIHGVDIDPQAVEVTKLSLSLKVLEGESQESIGTQLGLFKERALPDLGRNIQCGNSLIGPDYYNDRQLDLGIGGAEERSRVNAFDWQTAFPQVFARGGFDTVIGNPPYIQLSMMDYFNESVNKYLINRYSSSMGRLNTFGLFIERVLKNLLKQKGYLSFIVPNTLLTQEYYHSLRAEILRHKITNITTYQYPVFEDAVVETIVFVFRNCTSNNDEIEIVDFNNKAMSCKTHRIKQEVYLLTHKNNFLVTSGLVELDLKLRLDQIGVTLKTSANINQAIALKYDRSASLFNEKRAENFKPVLDGRHINRYKLSWGGQFLAYDVKNIHSCKRTDIFEACEKILFRRVGDRLIATCDDKQFYALNTLVVITLLPSVQYSLKYLLGLINSKLLNFYYVKFLKSTKKVFSEIQARQLAELPIYKINFSDRLDKVRHYNMVSLVERMLTLNKHTVRTPQEGEALQREIEATDKQIDALVYELYGLTGEEIKIVEGSENKR